MVDLGGYVIVLVETTDRRIRLYGSPADRADLEVGDEILEVNGRSLDDCTHTEVIAHIHQCIRSRTVCLRVRRRPRLVLDLSESSSNVQEAFVIAVEQQARERLERLSALQRIQPVDMTKLSQELNAEGAQGPQGGSNGLLLLASEASPVYVASVPQLQRLQRHDSLGETAGSDKSEAAAVAATANGHLGQTASYPDQELELTQDLPEEEPMSASPPVPTPRKSLSPSPGMKSPDGEPSALPAHREMAVDVPESFVAVAKTAPRYPPPPRPQGSPRLNGAAPTGEQLERIRKYQEEIRQRKEEEERIAQEQEFLRSSLRGSKKLRALAQGSEGILNDAFEADASFSTLPSDARLWTTSAPKPPTRTYNSRELEQCLERLEPLAEPGALGPVAALLREPGFQGALVVSNGVQEAWCYQRPPTPTCSHAQEVAQEVLSLLQGCALPEAAQLQDLLTRLEVEGLLLSHDRIAARCGAGPRWAHSPPGTGGAYEALDRAAHYSEDSIKIVHIDKTNEPLGATVRNEGESVIIGRIVKGGAAEKSGLLHEGDEVLEVNGIGMRGKSVNEVCDLLATMTGTLTFLIVPCGHEVIAPRSTDTGMIHVKAHFDYEPEEDPYIPCRELGIPFQKGDVLHVINRDDPNWWQAYRQGEEDQTLAGLIPSKSFQQHFWSRTQKIRGNLAVNSFAVKNILLEWVNATQKNVNVKTSCIRSSSRTDLMNMEDSSLGASGNMRNSASHSKLGDSDATAGIPHDAHPSEQWEGFLPPREYPFTGQVTSSRESAICADHFFTENRVLGLVLRIVSYAERNDCSCIGSLREPELHVCFPRAAAPLFAEIRSHDEPDQVPCRKGVPVREDELRETIERARQMEDSYGHYFDMVIVNSDLDRAYSELLKEVAILEREPQWVPSAWLTNQDTAPPATAGS
ncbi:unnamed protein product [Ixodes persulcatus]